MSMLKITLKRSTISCTANQKGTVAALGLRKIGAVVIKPDIPSIRGMVDNVRFMLDVEEISE